MTDNSNYIPSSDSQNEYSSDEVVEITQIPKLSAKKKKSKKLQNNQEKENESTTQTSTPFEETITQPSKSKSWVWNYFIKNFNEKGELRAYCQFIMENGEKCIKSYKYTGSTGNLNGHAIKHGIIPPENFETKSKSTQLTHKYEQKEKEESLLRWILLATQPLSTVTHKAYIEHMYIIDPEFIIPEEKKIRMMIAHSCGYNRDKLTQLLKTAQSISLTTDLWTSHSKHGYLDLTATWINQNFEIMNVLLEITYFSTPYTAIEIASTIKKIMQKWKIEDRVITITTDNGVNIVSAIHELKPIKRLSCAAHTLQLAIGKGLKLVETLTTHAKQLINFFSTQKQIERLIKVQKDSGYEESLHLIQDVSTR